MLFWLNALVLFIGIITVSTVSTKGADLFRKCYGTFARALEEWRCKTADHLTPDVIAADSVYTALDPDGLLFALVSSSMFITWQRTVGGALESRLRFSNTLT